MTGARAHAVPIGGIAVATLTITAATTVRVLRAFLTRTSRCFAGRAAYPSGPPEAPRVASDGDVPTAGMSIGPRHRPSTEEAHASGSGMGDRGAAILAVIVVAGVGVWPDDAQPGARRNDTMMSVSPPPPGALTVVAAGDICGLKPATCSPTADLIKTIDPDIALTLGDNQYGEGTLAQYLSGYDGAWGAFKDITYPVAGNHEWKTPAAQGYLDYFGTQDYWYTRTFGDWRFYALDGTCDANGGCGPGAPQYEWLQEQLATHTDRCILAYWHQPRFSSGTKHGSDEDVAPLWQLLDAAGADLVFNGHEHNYERFSAQDVQGVSTPEGMVEIVAGTGGTPNGYGFGDPLPNSEVRLGGSGVVELGLHEDGWVARFIRPSGEVSDQAEGSC